MPVKGRAYASVVVFVYRRSYSRWALFFFFLGGGNALSNSLLLCLGNSSIQSGIQTGFMSLLFFSNSLDVLLRGCVFFCRLLKQARLFINASLYFLNTVFLKYCFYLLVVLTIVRIVVDGAKPFRLQRFVN